jgi:hypothetical protein
MAGAARATGAVTAAPAVQLRVSHLGNVEACVKPSSLRQQVADFVVIADCMLKTRRARDQVAMPDASDVRISNG